MAKVSGVRISSSINMGTAFTSTDRRIKDFGDEPEDPISDSTPSTLQYGTNWEHLDHKMATEKMISKLRGKMKHRLGVKNHSKPFQQLDEYLTTLVTSEQPPEKPQIAEDVQLDKENLEITSYDHIIDRKMKSKRNTPKPSPSIPSHCQRCNRPVYFAERIEPNRGQILHKACFKCKECSVKLTLNTFFSNNIDLSDLEIYCKSHVPRHRAGVLSTSKQEHAGTIQHHQVSKTSSNSS